MLRKRIEWSNKEIGRTAEEDQRRSGGKRAGIEKGGTRGGADKENGWKNEEEVRWHRGSLSSSLKLF